MKITCSLFFLVTLSFSGLSQNTAGIAFDKKFIRNGRSEMIYYIVKDGGQTPLCNFIIEVQSNAKTLSVYTTLEFLHSGEKWKDTAISDINSFKPIYRSSYSKDKEFRFNYGADVTGYYLNKQSRKKEVVKEPVTQHFLDNYTYPYLLGLLPLTTGYKKDLLVYDYKPGKSNNVKKARIESVKNNVYMSPNTGEHKVWQVSVVEEATSDRYEYYIDKDNRRIWKIEVRSGAQQILLIDREADFNPVKATFDKVATFKMVNDGNAVITGQAFARDNQNGGMLKGMAILNINKKQFAAKGTGIILIPYTDYFKDWMKVNDELRKKRLQQVPLAEGAKECIKVTTVYDDNGHFEFVNLQPGEYLLYTQFSYIHQASRTETVGYTDTYINGIYQGSNANTETYNYSTNASAFIKKVVSIKTDGEKQEIKLKKTL